MSYYTEYRVPRDFYKAPLGEYNTTELLNNNYKKINTSNIFVTEMSEASKC